MTEHKVVSRDEWLAARRQLLAKDELPFTMSWVKRRDEYAAR